MKIGRIAQFLDDLKARRLLALKPVRIDRIDDGDRLRLTDFADETQGIIEIAVDRHNFGAVHEGLAQLAEGDLPRRQQHDAGDPRPRRVSGRGRGSIPGRGADHGLRSFLDRLRERHGHPAILERAGRVEPLVLHEDLAIAPDPRAQLRRMDERRGAFVQRDERRRLRHRKKLAVARDHPAILNGPFLVHEKCSTRIIRGGFLTQASPADTIERGEDLRIARAMDHQDERHRRAFVFRFGLEDGGDADVQFAQDAGDLRDRARADPRPTAAGNTPIRSPRSPGTSRKAHAA